MTEKHKNDMCSGNPVSAKSLSFDKGNKGRGKGSSRMVTPKVQPVEERNDANQPLRHGEHR